MLRTLCRAWRQVLAQPLPPLEKVRRLADRRLLRDYSFFAQFPRIPLRVVVDVGAHAGEFSRRVLRYCVPERLWLVEADPQMAASLRQQFARVPQAEVIPKAVADVTGLLAFHVNETPAASSLLPIHAGASERFGRPLKEVRTVRVPAITLDALFAEQDFGQVDLMKVDIQGGEAALIRGGQQALRQVRLLYLEVMFERTYTGCALFGELDGLLTPLGFKLQFLDDFRRNRAGDLLYANAGYYRPAG